MQVSPTQAIPDLHQGRRSVARLAATVGALVCIAVIVALIVTWPDHGHGSTSASDVAPQPAKQAGRVP
jgi:hypothetical protein